MARFDPASKVPEGQEAEIWVDATRLSLFDPDDGRNLTSGRRGRRQRARGAGETA